MNDVDELSSEEGGRVKAIIAPHAGYAYSGATMAFAYKHIKPESMYVSVYGFHSHVRFYT